MYIKIQMYGNCEYISDIYFFISRAEVEPRSYLLAWMMAMRMEHSVKGLAGQTEVLA
jgi:hypothetical protein